MESIRKILLAHEIFDLTNIIALMTNKKLTYKRSQLEKYWQQMIFGVGQNHENNTWTISLNSMAIVLSQNVLITFLENSLKVSTL